MALADRLDTFLDEYEHEQSLERQVEELRRRVEDLEEWLGSVAEDMLDRTARPIGRRTVGQ